MTFRPRVIHVQCAIRAVGPGSLQYVGDCKRQSGFLRIALRFARAVVSVANIGNDFVTSRYIKVLKIFIHQKKR